MTDEQKTKIAEMRNSGVSYVKIGEALGISKNTVKTFCRRNNLTAGTVAQEDYSPISTCRECGKALTQVDGQKRRVFCCRECREKWWHAHPERLNKKAVYAFQCAGCGKQFTAYGNNRRKYCSHECYIKARFKGGDRNE